MIIIIYESIPLFYNEYIQQTQYNNNFFNKYYISITWYIASASQNTPCTKHVIYFDPKPGSGIVSRGMQIKVVHEWQ